MHTQHITMDITTTTPSSTHGTTTVHECTLQTTIEVMLGNICIVKRHIIELCNRAWIIDELDAVLQLHVF